MYSSDFGGIVSDGQLHNMEREMMRREEHDEAEAARSGHEKHNEEREAGILNSLLSGIKTDDLILIAIGILLLLDGKSDNDLLAVILIVMFLI